jgi:hypothetical protein
VIYTQKGKYYQSLNHGHLYLQEELDTISFAFARWVCTTSFFLGEEDKVISKQLEPDTVPEFALSCLGFVTDFSEFLSRNKKKHLSQGKEKERKGRQTGVGMLGMDLVTGAQAAPISKWCMLTATVISSGAVRLVYWVS